MALCVRFPSGRYLGQIKATIANQYIRATIQEFLQLVYCDEWIHIQESL
jgi:hypothetical protein